MAVAGGGLRVAGAGVVAGVFVSVSVAGGTVIENVDAEEGKDQSAEDEDEQAEDDCVLDGGGVECDGGVSVRSDGDITDTRFAGFFFSADASD